MIRRVVAFLLIATSGAAAEPPRPRVAVLEIELDGDAPPELRTQLDRSLAGGLYAAGYEVVGREAVAEKLRAAPELVGCVTTTCLERVGTIVGAEHFVRVRVNASGAAYTLELELFGVVIAGAQRQSYGLSRRLERTCPVCTISEANEELSRAAAALGSYRARLDIRTHPSGAMVSVNGADLGAAPRTAEVVPGEITVRATAPGRKPTSRQLTVRAETTTNIDMTLPPLPASRRFGPWKWAASAGALGGIAGGVALIAIDGDETNCPDRDGPCKDLYDTLLGGVLVTGLGAALGAAAVYMFLHDDPAPRPVLVSTPHGLQAHVGWRF